MKNISNNLINVFSILIFVFGLSLAYPTYADYTYTSNGAVFYPDSSPTQVTAPISQTPVATQTNTNINNTNTNTNNTTTNTSTKNSNTNTSSTSSNKNSTSSSNNSTVSGSTNANNTVATTSDINQSYGSLTANALVGSNSFFPSGLMQWIILIIIILAIIFLWRYVHAEDDYLREPLKHA